jgi:3-deoxy-D-manno-octulosonic-acid transferase
MIDRLKLYRKLSQLVKPVIVPRIFSPQRVKKSFLNGFRPKAPIKKDNLIWFHAASAGELEALFPIILEAAQNKWELIVTAFSESAEFQLNKIKKELDSMSAVHHFVGYSPLEGEWEEAFKRLRPFYFVTAKYEAWPELWASLAACDSILVIVGAKERRSLRFANKACQLLGTNLPNILMLTVDEKDEMNLRKTFPSARVEKVGEPRWDQVVQRSNKGNPRAKLLIDQFKSVLRPWAMFAQVWPEDIRYMERAFSKVRGTIWIVPHKVDSKSVGEIQDQLRELGFGTLLTSSLESLEKAISLPPHSVILVDETGILTELYESMDWAYVGGGFSDGVHSTIEPAIRGIPILVGERGVDRFNEIEQLRKSGQLKVLHSDDDPEISILKLQDTISNEQKTAWRKEAAERLGATGKIISILNELRSS